MRKGVKGDAPPHRPPLVTTPGSAVSQVSARQRCQLDRGHLEKRVSSSRSSASSDSSSANSSTSDSVSLISGLVISLSPEDGQEYARTEYARLSTDAKGGGVTRRLQKQRGPG